MSDRTMTALRCAAGLVHAVPHTRLRIHHDDRVLLDVTRGPLDDDDVLQVPPCVFHHAVARAYTLQRAGRQLRLLDLPGGAVPAIDIGVTTGNCVLPGGVVRVGMGPIWVHLVAVARPIDDCVAVVGDAGLHGLGFHADSDLDVTLLHAGSPEGDPCRARAARETVEAALAHCTVAQLEDHLRAHAATTLDS
jgi:hypothetical protein